MHLVVVQHGLWGYPGNTAHLSLLLKERLGSGYFILNSNVNSGSHTYDGIDVCGDRLHALIQSTLESLAKAGNSVTAISLIGYSMGGLVNRYVAGKLYAEGVFTRVAPVNFITVATPHLGAWRMPITWYNRAFNYIVPVVTSRSGYQLVLQDKHSWGKPLLCLMSHPDLLFMAALRRFKKLMLLANVFHDRPVPYCTAAIRLDNPYEQNPPVPIDPNYPSIVTTTAAAAPAGKPAETEAKSAAVVRTEAALAADPVVSSGTEGESTVLKVSEPAATTTAVSPLPRRPLRSTYLPILFLVFLPLALPALLFMVVAGRQHHCKISRTALDFSWIQRHHRPNDDPSADPNPAQSMKPSGEQGRRSQVVDTTAVAAGDSAAGGTPGLSDRLPSDIECPSAPDLPTRRLTRKALAPLPVPFVGSETTDVTALTAAPASSPVSSALDDGDDGMVVSEQTVLLHDGIVELPAEVHRVQEWLVQQLNTLPWHKVDVDCRDLHAHAAIIMRNPQRFTHNRDVLDYLIDQFVRT